MADAAQTGSTSRDRATRARIAIGAFVGMTVTNSPILFITFGVFLQPVSSEFGWGRAVMPSALLVSAMTLTLLYPLVGWLLDRLGSRVVLIWGFATFGCAMAGLSFLDGTVKQLIVLLLLAAVLSTLPSGIAYARVIANAFSTNRGLVLGWCLGVGGGVGSALAPVLARVIMNEWGWRWAYVGLGLMPLIIGLPTAYWLLPKRRARQKSVPAPDSWGLEVPEILKTPQVWLVFGATFLSCCVNNATTVHLAAIATDRGVTPTSAALLLSATAIATLAGQFLIGITLDRVQTPRIALPIFASILSGVALIHYVAGQFALLPAAILIGLGQGSEYGILPYFVTRFFGLRSFGRVYGAIYALAALSYGVGPYFMGKTFDNVGSYGPAFFVLEGTMALALILVWRLRPYSYALDGSRIAASTVGGASS
jgi:MFS family permease